MSLRVVSTDSATRASTDFAARASLSAPSGAKALRDRGNVQVAGITKHPKLLKNCFAKIWDFMPPRAPGNADTTAATFPANGSVSVRLIPSRIFFGKGVMKPLYSGEAISRA